MPLHFSRAYAHYASIQLRIYKILDILVIRVQSKVCFVDISVCKGIINSPNEVLEQWYSFLAVSLSKLWCYDFKRFLLIKHFFICSITNWMHEIFKSRNERWRGFTKYLTVCYLGVGESSKQCKTKIVLQN